MLESIRRTLVVAPRLHAGPILSAATLFAFFWLLAHDAIQPVAVYLLQLYLVF